MFALAAFSIQDKQARLVAARQGRLSDEVIGQIEVEIGGEHLSGFKKLNVKCRIDANKK